MLDRSKLIHALHQLADTLFVDSTESYDLAQSIWKKIAQDNTFLYKVREFKQALWPVPWWDGKLDDVIVVPRNIQHYCVLSVDGSQIYPDRHHHISCFLINIGSVTLPYGIPNHKVKFNSVPYIFSKDDDKQLQLSTDLVNCRRQELEFKVGLELGKVVSATINNAPITLLFDGSLIFWHLASKDIDLREKFLSTYLATLHHIYQERIPVAGYISMPKSKELVNLVRLSLCDFDVSRADLFEPVNAVLDTAIANSFLQPYTRSIIFQNQSIVSRVYPDHIRPYFFYLHVGTEIGRVEIPAWIAHDEKLVDSIAQVLVDQCVKGHGYPVALAEAHEQAVVKGPDRDFFYHMLQKIGMDRNHRPIISRKSLRKRGMGI